MREMVEIFPAKVQKLWNDLELRVLVLLSLFLQTVLISTGNRRKYTRNRLVAVTLWLSYLSADAVATLALGVLSQAQADPESNSVDPSYTIMAFWAPFLIMHLGGPDTITAYALADNELWSRHLLALFGQVSVAVYVILKSWIGKPINCLSVPILVAGLVKYLERSWVLFSASRDQFRDSMVSRPDPGPNYAKFMDAFVYKEAEGYRVSLESLVDVNAPDFTSNSFVQDAVSVSAAADTNTDTNTNTDIDDGMVLLRDAYFFFGTFKRLFGDLILSFQDKETSESFFKKQSWGNAFGIVEVELGLVYDLFYTKAFILYSRFGFFLRGFSFSSTVAAFVAFVIIDKKVYPKTEVIITYFLLVGAIFLELYSVLIILSSDRTMIWLGGEWIRPLNKLKGPFVFAVRKLVSILQFLHVVPARKRWSNEMGQHNLLNCCIETKPMCTKLHQYLDKYLFWNSVSIPNGLKALIFNELKLRCSSGAESGGYRGDKVLLGERNCFDKSDEIEFDQSVLLWHVATDLCYHADVSEAEEPNTKELLYQFTVSEESSAEEILKFKREMSRRLSDYMVYLLIMSPFMLPSGIGQIRFYDTCAEADEFFEGKEFKKKRDACSKLRRVDVRIPPSDVKGDRSKSLLFDACRLAKSLELLGGGEKWEKIFQAWLDIVTYAAAQCRWNDHAEKLSQGGELLTHVWLLMAHFGMTDQFQISQGYVRAKLLAK